MSEASLRRQNELLRSLLKKLEFKHGEAVDIINKAKILIDNIRDEDRKDSDNYSRICANISQLIFDIESSDPSDPMADMLLDILSPERVQARMGPAAIQVTFTGVDICTDPDRMEKLSKQYGNVEWAMLFSQSRQGTDQRYPDLRWAESFRFLPVRKAAHLCGKYARDIMQGERPDIDLAGFDRVQVNHAQPIPEKIAEFAAFWKMQGIMQIRDLGFPSVDCVQMLYDRSGGTGRFPSLWPQHPGKYVGYAGGISPDTIGMALRCIKDSRPVWIDMESGVRTHDWLDLDKCEAVLEAVAAAEKR